MITVREAKEQDFPFIIALIKNELGYPDLIETKAYKRLEYFDKNDDWVTFVAIDEDDVVGFIGVKKNSLSYGIEGYNSEIKALAVSDKVRNKGVGTALIKSAEDWSLSHGVDVIRLTCSLNRTGSHTFYEKNGYRKISYAFIKHCE